MSPRQVHLTVCRWALGSCPSLDQSTYRPEPWIRHVYEFYDPKQPIPCRYRFFFSRYGLVRLTLRCKLNEQAQFHALLQRYQRWFGPPQQQKNVEVNTRWSRKKQRFFSHFPSSFFQGKNAHTYQWKEETGRHPAVFIEVKQQHVYSDHLALQHQVLAWEDWLLRLGPHPSSFRQKFRAISPKLRRRVLTEFYRLMNRLSLYYRRHLRLPLSAPWTPDEKKSLCRSTPIDPGQWNHSTWQKLRFSPQGPNQLLQYRYRYLSPRWKMKFALFARGCGYFFSLVGDTKRHHLRYGNKGRILLKKLRF